MASASASDVMNLSGRPLRDGPPGPPVLSQLVTLPIVRAAETGEDQLVYLERVAERTEELAGSVGPLGTLIALARLEDALVALDEVAGDPRTVDLDDALRVLSEAEPVILRAEHRVEGILSALGGV